MHTTRYIYLYHERNVVLAYKNYRNVGLSRHQKRLETFPENLLLGETLEYGFTLRRTVGLHEYVSTMRGMWSSADKK